MTESTKFIIFEELLKYPDEVITLAVLYARHFVMYGADVTEKWQTAVVQAAALDQAYNQGIADEIKRQLMNKPQPAQPNVGDMISRQDAIDLAIQIIKEWHGLEDDDADAIKYRFMGLPSAQRKGKWIEFDSDEDKYDLIKCSCCEHIFTVDSFHWSDRGFVKDDFNFCPICGASMKGEKDE